MRGMSGSLWWSQEASNGYSAVTGVADVVAGGDGGDVFDNDNRNHTATRKHRYGT